MKGIWSLYFRSYPGFYTDSEGLNSLSRFPVTPNAPAVFIITEAKDVLNYRIMLPQRSNFRIQLVAALASQ